MAHTSSTIAAFADGETRLVYAAQVDDPLGPLVLLADGTANDMRLFTKAHLGCFVPECPTPRFTTVSRREGRDGFRHLTGGGHSEESLFHKQGKHALLDWLARKHPDVDARPEVSLLPVVDRRADVLATHPTRERVALEVQYSGLDAADARQSWATRTRDYLDAGVAPVWFLGHRGVHFTPMYEDTVAVGSVARAILDAGMPLWWLNPIIGMIAIPYVVAHVGNRAFRVPPTGKDRRVHLWIEPLDSLVLTLSGVHHPRLDDLAEQRDALQAAETARRLQEELRAAAARANAERARAAAAREKARVIEQRALRLQAAQQTIEAQNAVWETSTMLANVLARHGGRVPEHLDLPSDCGGICANRQHWQATVYGHVMHNKVGSTATVDDCLRSLAAQGIRYNRREASETVLSWVARLDELGHVLLDPGVRGTFTVTDVSVEVTRRTEVANRERRAHTEASAEVQRVRVGAARTRDSDEAFERVVSPDTAISPRQRPILTSIAREPSPPIRYVATDCRVCATPLDEFLAKQGITQHTGCVSNVGRSDNPPRPARRQRMRACKGCANALPSHEQGPYHDGCAPWQVRRAATGIVGG